ncbi:WXG100 family type VII secretion target [Nocardia amikacinitolerans]|uniref:WXG100 family type VII secretion target n=1 Tax=Nocardia amikacinitolerans TaxID=756689 RepID=UPI00369E9617
MSLQVDPAVLHQGATALRQYQGLLYEALSIIRAEHARLAEVWSGPAADHISAVWSELHPRISTHIDKLGQHATSLTSVAQQVVGKDQQFSTSITATTSSLDLP